MDLRLEYRIAFSRLKGVTPSIGSRLLALTGGEENFFTATCSQLKALVGSDSPILADNYRSRLLEAARREADFIRANSIRFIYFSDPCYPYRLLECDDAPLSLFGLGECDLNARHIVSIVGTRHATPYGISFINSLVKGIAESVGDVVIVSGLAYGADIAAHRAAMKSGLKTAAVFAHGLNTVYPSAHRNDAAAIIRDGGAVLTEYTHADPIHRANFLARNRIIAGLADCTVVAESAEKGGAIVTARIAGSYNRDVFALPGRSSDPYSRGCNRMIAANSAALIQDADDLIDAMRWDRKPTEGNQPQLFPQLSENEQTVVDLLKTNGEARLNEISIKTAIPIGRLMSVLVDLEFKGIIINYPGGKYMLA